jgi:hypothetical protein
MTKKKIFIAIAAAAIPAAFVAIAVKTANRLVKEVEEEEGDNAECSAEVEDEGEDPIDVSNDVQWWTGSRNDGNRQLHHVRLATSKPLDPDVFETFTKVCREKATAREAVAAAMKVLYENGYEITSSYTYDSK